MNTFAETIQNAFHFFILQSIVGGVHDLIVDRHRVI